MMQPPVGPPRVGQRRGEAILDPRGDGWGQAAGMGFSPLYHTHEPIAARVRAVLPLLACTECHGALVEEKIALVCPRCGHRYRQHDGVMDFAPFSSPAGVAQRLVEAPALAPLYESLIRPLLTHAVTHLDPLADERWLDRWLADVGELAEVAGVERAVLDLGCGSGRFTRLLAAQLDEPRVLGVDLNPALLQEARQQAERCGLPIVHLRADAVELPVADRALAAACCFRGLPLWSDPAVALSEVARVLVPGGRFVGLALRPARAPLLRRIEERLSERAAVHLLDEPGLLQLLSEAGFDPLSVERDGLALRFAARRRGDEGLGSAELPRRQCC